MITKDGLRTSSRFKSGRRIASLAVTGLVLFWSVQELVNLSINHHTGPEMYGVLAAAIAVAVSGLSLYLLATPRPRTLATVGVLALWTLVALTGIGGVAAHIIGPEEGHGPVDNRPRPVAAPLIFTAVGLVGGAALAWGQRVSVAGIKDGLTQDQRFMEVTGWRKQR